MILNKTKETPMWLSTRTWLALIVLIGLFTRFFHLAITPGWFGDEGVNLNIAYNLLHGRAQLFSVAYPFLPHPPLFFIVSFAPLLLFGKSIFALRLVSAACGTINLILIYLLAKELFNSKRVGLIASTALLTFTAAIISSRLALTYEFFITLAFLSFIFMAKSWIKGNPKSLLFSSLFAALATITSPLGLPLIFLNLILIFLKKPRGNYFKIFTALFLPIIAYLGVELIFNYGYFVEAIRFIFSRIGDNTFSTGSGPLITSFSQILGSSLIAMLAFLGLIINKKSTRVFLPLIVLFLILFELVTKGSVAFGNETYYAIIFIPIGFALLADLLIDQIVLHSKYERLYAVVAAGLAIVLLVPFGVMTYRIVEGKYLGTNQEVWFSPDSIQNAKDTANFLNSKTNSNSLVMASPAFASLLTARAFDPMQASTYLGNDTLYYPAAFRKEGRFVYSASFNDAEYAVVDKTTKNWFAFQKNVRIEVLEPFWNSWPRVFVNSDYIVFKNPGF
jgi:hypothetical protein